MNLSSGRHAIIALSGLALLTLTASTARADVIFLGEADLSGTGIGGVATLLSLQDTPSESAFVGRNASGTADVAGGDLAALGNTQTRTFDEIGITQASDLRLILNINEPGPDNMVTLTDLTVNVFDGGSIVFSGSLAEDSLDLTVTNSGGIGSSGLIFGLDAAQAAELQAVLSPDLRIGIDASLTNTAGGFETFFVGNQQNNNVIPEPGTLALLAAGALPVIGLVARRRRK